ncbi:Terminase-like family protein [compost metagenome]
MNFQWTKVHGTMRDGRDYINDPERHDEQAVGYGAITSPNYRAMVLGEFPLSDSDSLIPREYIDNAIENTDVLPSEDVPRVWGLDPSGQGRDKSVLCIRHDNTATFKWWDKTDAVQLFHYVQDRWNKTPKAQRPVKICVDANGIGHGVASMLRAAGLPVLSVMPQARPTRKPDLFLNMRALMWVECRDWICSDEFQVCIPNINELIEDLTAPNYWEVPKYKIEAKADIKKRTGRSTDFADALCLTFAPSKIALMQASSNGGKIEYDQGYYSQFE